MFDEFDVFEEEDISEELLEGLVSIGLFLVLNGFRKDVKFRLGTLQLLTSVSLCSESRLDERSRSPEN